MKRIFMLCAGLCALELALDKTIQLPNTSPILLKIGGMVIIREKGNNKDDNDRDRNRCNNATY